MRSRSCWQPDVFGVSGGLAQILARSGIEFFLGGEGPLKSLLADLTPQVDDAGDPAVDARDDQGGTQNPSGRPILSPPANAANPPRSEAK